MSTTIDTAPTKEIERRYEVILAPLDGPDDGRGLPYEPMRVRLRYSIEEAAELGSLSQEAMDEVTRRAQRLERQRFITAGDTVLDAQSIRFLGEGLVDYLPRQRPKARR